jgi:hypothetical protein
VLIAWDQTDTFSIKNFTLQNSIVEGPSSATQDSAAFTNVDTLFLANSVFRNMTHPVNVYITHRSFLDNLVFDTFGAYASLVLDDNNYVSVRDCDFTNAAQAIYVDKTKKMVFDGAIFAATARPYLYTQAGTGAHIKFLNCFIPQIVIKDTTAEIASLDVNNCTMIAPADAGGIVCFVGAGGSTISNVKIQNCDIDETLNTRHICGVNAWTITNWQEQGNSFVNRGAVWNTTIGAGVKIQHNLGYPTDNTGSSAIASGETHVHVTHGLGNVHCRQTPTKIWVTPTAKSTADPTFYVWVNNIGDTEFIVNCAVDPGVLTLPFIWYAEV